MKKTNFNYSQIVISSSTLLLLVACGGGGSNNVEAPVVAVPTPEFTNVVADSGYKLGTISTGSTDDSTPVLSGKLSSELSAGQIVVVYDGAKRLTPAATVNGTSWTLTPSAPLTTGTHSLTVQIERSTDGTPLGNASAAIPLTIVPPATLSDVQPRNAIRGSSYTFTATGINLPTTNLSVHIIPMAWDNNLSTCQLPSDLSPSGFSFACRFYTVGSQTLEIRSGSQVIGNITINVQTDVVELAPPPAPIQRYAKVGIFDKTDCVKDNDNGLIWEGKTTSGLRSGENKYYTNYSNINGTIIYTTSQINATTNTAGYVAAVNKMVPALCGYTDWRLPTRAELEKLVKVGASPAIDTEWFPNTQSGWYWSSTTYASDASYAWVVYFTSGLSNYISIRDNQGYVRLVRSAN